MYVQTIQKTYANQPASEILTVDMDKIIPQIEQDSRMMQWMYQDSVIQLGRFSDLIKQVNYDQLLSYKSRSDYTKEFFFQNVIQSVYNEQQSINRDSIILERRIKQILNNTNFGALMFAL